MNFLDWVVLGAILSLIFACAWWFAGKTESDRDWFLAGRSLPFWAAGISMFATSLDAGEQIAITGYTYGSGISILTHYWLGLPIAYILASFYILPRLYQAGMFTNAEYLEARFGPGVRILSVFVQIQYRTNILASMSLALHLVITDVLGWTPAFGWGLVVFFALGTTLYTAYGGLKTIASVDLLLSGVMIAATSLFWFVLMGKAGGWGALGDSLAALDLGHLLEIGATAEGSADPRITVVQWIIIAVGFVIVNHTQTMKMLGARSLWDLKMAVLLVVAISSPILFLNGTFGIIAHALLPESTQVLLADRPDRLFPQLVELYLAPGLKGLIVAGVVAAAMSTYEGISSALSALTIRDFYARVIAPHRTSRHYLQAGRITTCLIVSLSFLYIPFILRFSTMMDFFLRVTNIFVTPLMTIYLMGSFTRCHRRSGLWGLASGAVYGILAMTLDGQGILPDVLTHTAWTYVWSVVVTSLVMILVSSILGWEEEKNMLTESPKAGWLAREETTEEAQEATTFRSRLPIAVAILILAVNSLLTFYIFW